MDHAGELVELNHTPGYLVPGHVARLPRAANVSCSYCGVGDTSRYRDVAAPGRADQDKVVPAARLARPARKLMRPNPTPGCVKFRSSAMEKRSAYPIHVAPSVLDRATGRRVAISYAEAVERLAEIGRAHV